MFHSLKVLPMYNNLLLYAVRLLLLSHISLRVYHIDGLYNTIADALSRSLFDMVRSKLPGITIHLFEPPRDALGATLL